MEFWNLINKGLEYYEKKMFDCACKYFNQAKKLRKDGAYLTEIIHLTKNFNSMFTCDDKKESYIVFNAYFDTIKETKRLYSDKKIEEDIYGYIMTRLLDLKAMFLKSIKHHLCILSERTEYSFEILKLYGDFKEYLQKNKEKIINNYMKVNKDTDNELIEQDIELLISWCDIIVLNDYNFYENV